MPPASPGPTARSVVVNLVLVYEEGSEYSVAWGDDRNDGWGEYADPGVQPPQRDPGTESHYEYGSRAGVWRLARIFDEAGVQVTVSAAAVALELNPEVARLDARARPRPARPRLALERAVDARRDEERALIARAIESFERVLGTRPVGWSSRSWPSENTRSLLLELGGFIYHSEGYSDDVPYYESIDGTPMLVVPYSRPTTTRAS